jgi:hypothetical protein
VSKGKGILQPHRILDTLDEVQVPGGSVFAEGPFLDILRSSQVRRQPVTLARFFPEYSNNSYPCSSSRRR